MKHQPGPAAKAKTLCIEPSLACAKKATPVFAIDGALWLIWATDDRVLVARSTDLGKSFDAPIRAHPEPLSLDWGPDARPKLVFDRAGRMHVLFAIFKDKAFNGQAYYTHAPADGLTFAPITPVTPDAESQRFEVVGINREGRLFTAWLDKRARAAARQAGQKYAGAALSYAWGNADAGSLGDTQLAKEGTCECCRLALAFNGSGQPAVMFRNIFEGSVRDHAVITFADANSPGPVRRVAADNWSTDACPHHGPSLAIAPNGDYHVAWFTDGKARQGIFYARSSDAGATFSPPMPIGMGERNPSRPFLLASQNRIWLAWKEFAGDTSTLMVMSSKDDGLTWSSPATIARTADDSDHPLLISNGAQVFASWLTKADGYRLIPVENAP